MTVSYLPKSTKFFKKILEKHKNPFQILGYTGSCMRGPIKLANFSLTDFKNHALTLWVFTVLICTLSVPALQQF